ncbi:hypothetical protein ONZ45_g5855 [Pleurotus djamor]|nr:hypothetical protein ONZ45_g5855 [Pleurotus djamor]
MTVEGGGDFVETQRLLQPGYPTSNYLISPSEGAALHRDEESHDTTHGEHFDDVPQEKRRLGTFSAMFMIFNSIIGTGIYATPSNILRSAGSVGVALIMWLVGTLIAASGTAVYMELGTGLPRSGGEKNYLEFMYRYPRFLTTCLYMVYGALANLSSGNSLVAGEYLMHALGLPGSQFNVRTTAILCLTTNVILHGVVHRLGLRIQNTLGVLKLLFLSAISLTGILCLMGAPGFQVREGYDKPNNSQWDRLWEGSGTGVNALITGMHNVFWSFVGYNAANYALSETKDPVRTLTRAAPIAVFSAATVYLLVNVAYFAVVSKSDILSSRQIIASVTFFLANP